MDETQDPHEDEGRPRRGRLSRRKKIAILTTLLSVLLCGGLAAAGFGLQNRYEKQVQRADILEPPAGPPEEQKQQEQEQEKREKRWEDGPLNLLLLGSDSRSGEPDQASVSGQRSDTIMLLHLNAARNQATIVSVPRDSYVHVPQGGANWSGGMNKLNAAFAFGGPALAAKTMTRLIGVPLDGVIVADFSAVRQMIDAVGGVRVCLPYDVVMLGSQGGWAKGCHQLDGNEANELMRQRYGVPGGDFGRIHDQQLVIKALVEKITKDKVAFNPVRFDRLLTTAAKALVVDRELDIRKLAMALRHIRPDAVEFVTAPHTRTATIESVGSVVILDEAKTGSLFAAIRDDTLKQWVADNPQPPPSY
ncbi:LCP family protein [Micromonospora sonneratiae]|uniref:LCP family protein n=1 Tax=Micromonospora sonneratiae TaxID=1184706 RepID=A0ABW3YN27_9ACTN